jgi:hypothetical protein
VQLGSAQYQQLRQQPHCSQRSQASQSFTRVAGAAVLPMTDKSPTPDVAIGDQRGSHQNEHGEKFDVTSTATAIRRSAPPRFPERLQFRCPPALTEMLATAADREMTTASDYVRRAVVLRLRADGYELSEQA